MIPHRRPLAQALALLVVACAPESGDEAPRAAPNPLLRPERFTEIAPPEYRVRLATTAGDIVIQVHRDWAPLGADRFYNLVKAGFFDDSRVYRVVPGFMAQFGLNADPHVTRAWKTRYIVDDPVSVPNTRGRVAFAKAGVHTRTTELFISYKDNTALDAQGFSPIGEVVEGMEAVDAFVGSYGDGPPRGDGPYQAMVEARGNAYLDVDFPDLTRIVRATIEP